MPSQRTHTTQSSKHARKAVPARFDIRGSAFVGYQAGLVFVTAAENRRTVQTFVPHIARESEIWIAEGTAHIIHFNDERFLRPYPDVMPIKMTADSHQSRSLATLRDPDNSGLPKLLSGELSVTGEKVSIST